jgi:hypothetical protein
MSYIHILTVKIWCNHLQLTIDSPELLDEIIQKILSSKLNYYGYIFNFERTNWTFPQDQFGSSDIIIHSPFGSDILLLDNVKKFIKKIDEELHKENILLYEQEIIFQLVKLLQDKKKTSENSGYLYWSNV